MEKAIEINPDDQKLRETYKRVQSVIATEENKDNAFFQLRFVGIHRYSQLNLISAILDYKPQTSIDKH